MFSVAAQVPLYLWHRLDVPSWQPCLQCWYRWMQPPKSPVLTESAGAVPQHSRLLLVWSLPHRYHILPCSHMVGGGSS